MSIRKTKVTPSAYNKVAPSGRTHATVNHSRKEWARDDDGDGIREVYTNTIEGIWTGLRNFLRNFRGVHKQHLHPYVVMHEWAHNLKTITMDFLRAMTIPDFTLKRT
jgi:transposase